jgi:uncharacterized protein involved in response to NO
MLQIEETTTPSSFALFELGFRPFFSAAGIFAVVAILLWMLLYVFSIPLSTSGLVPMYWHAHEMIYGYAMAVVAGFLLTAVGNWTGIVTLRGGALAALSSLWLFARAAFFLPLDSALVMAAITDLLFALGLIFAVSLPVIHARQWKQLGIVSKLCLILIANALFYAGALGYFDQGSKWGLYVGLYSILALVFTMARRVIPGFIERGFDEAFSARNRSWVDITSLALFILWALLDIFTQWSGFIAWLSLLLCVIHAVRLWDWYTPGIWQKPLLWSLYLAYAFLTLGFLLKSLSVWLLISPYLALHAFAYGGIGLMTLSMMSRVALGHTGRNVFDPPKLLGPLFLLIVLGTFIRVLIPIFDVTHYRLWIALSQILWMFGFSFFLVMYFPMLIRPRIDGRRG